MPEPISITIGFLIAGAAKAGAAKAVVAGSTKLAAGGAMKSAAITSSHITAAHATVSSSAMAASALSVVEGIVLGAVGLAVLERLLHGRNVGPTGEKVAHKLAACVEKGIISETEAQSRMTAVETVDDKTKQAVNEDLKGVFRRHGM